MSSLRFTPLLAIVALAGCSGGDAGGESGGNAATTTGSGAAGAASGDTASGSDVPRVKPGLWEMAMTMPGPSGKPINTKMKMCIGEPKPGENPFVMKPAGNTSCARNEVTRTSTGWAIDNECTGEGITTKSRGTVTGDLESAYKTVLTSTSSGPNVPAYLQTETTTEIDSRHLGACPAGVQQGQAVP